MDPVVDSATLCSCPGKRFGSQQLFLMTAMSSGCSSHRFERSGFGGSGTDGDSLREMDEVEIPLSVRLL